MIMRAEDAMVGLHQVGPAVHVPTPPRPGPTTRIRVTEATSEGQRERQDMLATEEPMEIRLAVSGLRAAPVVVTMRTPGHDFELAAGYLASEGLVRSHDIARVSYCASPDVRPEERNNVVTVSLHAPPHAALPRRAAPATAACGVCGRSSLAELELRGVTAVAAGPVVERSLLCALPDRLRAAQTVFARTGGLHAAGLVTEDGRLLCVREDVGRHNAVDKVIGWAVLGGRLPLDDHLLVVSGRAGFEIVQKALTARIPLVAAVGAPSSLAVDLARQFGMTLIGFVRRDRVVAYSAPERIIGLPG
jgi:FdhD protein